MSLRDLSVSWVLGESWLPDPVLDMDQLRDTAPTWGSWRSWRACGTHNVICHDADQAQHLVQRAFHAVCNLYIPQAVWQQLGQPQGVRAYGGDFPSSVPAAEDIVALHLAAANSDIVLVVGLDISLSQRLALFQSRVAQNSQQQWVWIQDQSAQTPPEMPNLTCDRMENVIQLLV